eukprot:scaffold270730_cov30-Tisochrysis_lutea.AAC.2
MSLEECDGFYNLRRRLLAKTQRPNQRAHAAHKDSHGGERLLKSQLNSWPKGLLSVGSRASCTPSLPPGQYDDDATLSDKSR